MKPFAPLTPQGKIRRYHQLAKKALQHYPIKVKKIRCLGVRYNVIFRVDAEEGVFALRISGSQHRTRLQVQSEMQWVDAISQQSDIRVARPLRSKTNELVITVQHDAVPDPRSIVLMDWCYGVAIHQRVTTKIIRQYGQIIARLNTQSEAFQPQGDFMTFDAHHVDEYGDLSYLDGEHPLLNSKQQALFREAIVRVEDTFKRLQQQAKRLYLVHADLQHNNAIVYRGNMSLIDFDDCRWGHFVQDIIPALSWLYDTPELADALLVGYTEHRPLPCSETDLKIALTYRGLWGLNYLIHYRWQALGSEPIKAYANQLEATIKASL